MSHSSPDRRSLVARTKRFAEQVTVASVKFLQPVFDWIGRHEPHVLASMLVAAIAVWGFIEVADEVREGETLGFDQWAVLIMRRPDDLARPIGPDWLAEAGRDLTALGGVAVLSLFTIAVAGFLWMRKMFAAMWLVLAATIGGAGVSWLLKATFARPRPELVPHLSIVHTSSFPSGHSMLSAVVYLTLGALLGRFVETFRLKAYCLIVACALTFLVGVSRVYLGVHYPTDVLAGWAAGLAWALVCWLVARYLQRRGAIESSAE